MAARTPVAAARLSLRSVHEPAAASATTTLTAGTDTSPATVPAEPRALRRLPRPAAYALVAVAYYLGARLGLGLVLVGHSVTPLWPPSGIAVAALLLLGRRVWPAVAVAAFVVNLEPLGDVVPAAVTAAGNTAAPLLAVSLLRPMGFRTALDRRRDALAIVFPGALLAMTVSASVGTGVLVRSGRVPLSESLSTWFVWWTGDAMGVLVVTPFLLSLVLAGRGPRWDGLRRLEAVFVLVLVTAIVGLAALSRLPVLFLALPVVGWAAWRFQLRGAAPAALIASLLATWAAAHGQGSFEASGLLDRMLVLQAFNACTALTSFFLAAVVSERRQQHDVREAYALRDHQIAETLQRNLLPDELPTVPGVDLAARYVPATSDLRVGGDWYDVFPVPGRRVGLAIGDVAGHGLQAAATMAQVRMGLRAYAVQDPSPPSVLRGVHALVAQLSRPAMVTLTYALFDPATRELRVSSAGHPPALVSGPGGTAFLGTAHCPPLGVTPELAPGEETTVVPVGATLVLYTDGLVERRGHAISEGLDGLREAARRGGSGDLDAVADGLVGALLDPGHVADDVALVLLRPRPLDGRPLRLTVEAHPQNLAAARTSMREWLAEVGASAEETDDLLVACGEACANVVQHAYSGSVSPGSLTVDAQCTDGSIDISICDEGAWRAPVDRLGGWGMQLIEALVDTVEVDRTVDGTSIRLRRRLGVPREAS